VAATHTVTSTAIAQKAAHARRQLPDSTSAIGPDTATPTPVPALTTVWTRSARSAGTHRATASASGGEARPVLDPATTTPTARTGTFGATAITPVPSTAARPAAVATARGPQRTVASVAATTATQ
jgi:hypothetical protein